MAVISWSPWSGATCYINISSQKATVTASANTFTLPMPTVQAKLVDPTYGSSSAPYVYMLTAAQKYTNSSGTTAYTNMASSSWSSGVAYNVYGTISNLSNRTMSTSSLFNARNSTSLTNSVQVVLRPYPQGYLEIGYNSGATRTYQSTSGETLLWKVDVTLNAPPTFSSTQVTFDTPYVYTGLTTASVTISNLSAKYSGTIANVTLKIGAHTASRTTNGTLSIPLTEIGTFTPTVAATDSRGQTTVIALDPITVNGYVPPSAVISAERTTAAGVLDDEGTTCLVTAQLSYTDVITNLAQPTVKVNGTTTSTTWYETRASDGTVADPVTWANYNPTSPVTLYGIVSGSFNTQTAFQIGVTPNDSIGSGTEITAALSSAFYTVDFFAGGHGIAFGQPASREGFHCNMDTYLKQETYIGLLDYQTAGTDDEALYDAIVALGWGNDVIE